VVFEVSNINCVLHENVWPVCSQGEEALVEEDGRDTDNETVTDDSWSLPADMSLPSGESLMESSSHC
jgi:hypothetical protein